MKLYSVGCSFTEGQGLHRQAFEAYTTKLAEKIDIEFFNFGNCGASNDYIFRKAFELINSNTIKKEDIIIVQWSHYMRKEIPTIVDKKKFYHSIPTSYHANTDKEIFKKHKVVQNQYLEEDLAELSKKIELENKEILDLIILKFLHEDYQKNSTINYINSLYTYLEHFGYKHIHFFGWDECVIESVFNKKEKFIKETFGDHAKIIGREHPDSKSHKSWAEVLYKKAKELNYLDNLDFQINNYRNKLHKLSNEIQSDIETVNENFIEEQKVKLEKEMQKIKNNRLQELEMDIEENRKKLDSLKEQIKAQIEMNEKQLEALKKPKIKSII